MNEFKKKNKNENLDSLLAKFYSTNESKQIKDDFSFADELFEKFSAAEPTGQTIKDVKRKIAVRLSAPEYINWPRVILQTAAVACMVIAAAVLTLPDRSTDNGAAKTQGQDIQLVSETDISLYEAEVAQLNSELLTLNYGEENGTNGTLLDRTEQVELEIIETDNTFWKG